jgi:HNH endonuclease/NUMOD4 motif
VVVPIPGHPGYKVSSFGNVVGIDRIVVNKNGRRHPYKGQILKPWLDTNGRPQVNLTGRRTVTVSTLVASTFLGPRPPGQECCHWDDDPTNNRLFNLRWDTRAANQHDLVRNGRNLNANKTHCVNGHPYDDENTIIHIQPNGSPRRICRTCHRAWSREHMRRKRALLNTWPGSRPSV